MYYESLAQYHTSGFVVGQVNGSFWPLYLWNIAMYVSINWSSKNQSVFVILCMVKICSWLTHPSKLTRSSDFCFKLGLNI